jgi:hypothetical protein
VFENWVLKIFGPKRDEITGGWRRLCNKEFHNMFALSNIIIRVTNSRRMSWMGHVACVGEMRNAYKILVRKHQGKRPLRRPRSSWGDNIRMNYREIGWEDVDWVHLTQDGDLWWAHVNMVMNLWVPYKVGNILKS